MRSFLVCCLFGLLLALTAYAGMFSNEPPELQMQDRTTIIVQREFQEAGLTSNAVSFVETALKKFERSPGVLVPDIYIEKQHPDYRNALRCYANLIRTREIELAKKYTERVGDKPEVVSSCEAACSLTS